MCDVALSRQFILLNSGVKMQEALAASYLYGKFHQGLPIGTVTALRALLLRLANVTGGPSAEVRWSWNKVARRAAHDTCYRLFLPFCAAACEPEPDHPSARGGGGGAPPRPLAPRRPVSGASRAEQKSARRETTQSRQDACTTSPLAAPRRPVSGVRTDRTDQKSARKETTQSAQDACTTGPPRTPWFASTLGVSGRTQREWRPDLEEWRNCLCLE